MSAPSGRLGLENGLMLPTFLMGVGAGDEWVQAVEQLKYTFSSVLPISRCCPLCALCVCVSVFVCLCVRVCVCVSHIRKSEGVLICQDHFVFVCVRVCATMHGRVGVWVCQHVTLHVRVCVRVLVFESRTMHCCMCVCLCVHVRACAVCVCYNALQS